MKHTDSATATNGYQSYAATNVQQQPEEGGGNLLALICGSLCKDTPLAEMFGPPPNDNANNNTAAQPLMTPIQNGEHLKDASILWNLFIQIGAIKNILLEMSFILSSLSCAVLLC